MNKLLATTLIVATGSIALSLQLAAGQDLEDGALLEHLQSGGLVLVFRHGETGPDSEQPDAISGRYALEGSTKERQAAYLDCDRQRNLSDEGRANLQKVAEAIRVIGPVIEEVFSSPMCRTRESAWLLAGQVTAADALIGPDNEKRQRLVSSVPVDGGNRILVSHGYVVSSIVPNPDEPDERGQIVRGHAHVLEPLGDGEFRILAELGPDDWTRLAGLVER
jgi:phosphohistidine phosphatase SixA